MLSALFKFLEPKFSSSPILEDVIRSFELQRPCGAYPPPPWDLDLVLHCLKVASFEP